MDTTLYLDNIKCHGCAHSISSKLEELKVNQHQIDVENGAIQMEYDTEEQLESIKKVLKKLGYPERDQSNLGDRAKSYISCLVGRIKS